jgi:heat shock protein HtpX
MSNGIRTTMLMALMIVLFALVGRALGGQSGMILALVIAVGMNFASYWFSDKIVLKMYRAQEVSREEVPELYEMVDRLRQRANLPMPKLYIIPNDQPNAFATGRNPSHAAVAVTNGITRILSPDDLEGVIAHELAHVKNRDILTSSIAATLGASITMIARFGVFFGGRGNDRGGAVGNILMLILAPIAAVIIQMAISRSREYAADRDGAQISGRPRSLASALNRLQQSAERHPINANPSTAHLFIVNPFAGALGGVRHWFSTHPPTEKRIERLMEMEGS